jgi:hypothetical protein
MPAVSGDSMHRRVPSETGSTRGRRAESKDTPYPVNPPSVRATRQGGWVSHNIGYRWFG